MRSLCSFAAGAVGLLVGSLLPSAAGPLEDAATVGEHPVMKLELLNLGPIGARGLMEQETRYPLAGYFIGTTIEVRHIFPDGPAAGLLRIGDVITGVNGRPFGSEKFRPTVPDYHQKQNLKIMAEGKFEVQAYRELGHAIDTAEGDAQLAGKLTLSVLRESQPMEVIVPLKTLGTHPATYPFGDEKSARIVADACRFLAEHQSADGRWLGHAEPTGPAMITAVAGLALLASGDEQYLPNVQKAVNGMLDKLFSTYAGTPLYKLGLQNWHLAFACIFASEYHLRTGDKAVLPRLQVLSDYILELQLVTADHGLGGWGHGRNPENPGPHPKVSYRELNICGAQNLVALALMGKVGITIPEKNLAAARRYIELTAGETGAVDYSHWALSAGRGSSPGATGAGLVGWAVLDQAGPSRTAMARWLSAHFLNAPHNHGSVLIGMLWTSLGLAASDAAGFRAEMDEFRWYFTLARMHDGSFTCLPGNEANVGKASADRTLGRYWCTAVDALILSTPRRNLCITGKVIPHP